MASEQTAPIPNLPGTKQSWQADCSGIRIDQYISSQVQWLSRSQAQRLIRDGLVNVNGRTVKPSLVIENGDVIELQLPPRESNILASEPFPLVVVYEDDHVVVVEKPAGILVHPTSNVRTSTLVNAMLARYPEIRNVGPEGRQGVVHRLDKDTSGLVVFARSLQGLRHMQKLFKTHDIWKTYQALIVGKLAQERGVIDGSIGRHPRDGKRMAVVVTGGRPARTQYEVLEELPGYSLIHAHPLTGRTHQIRVHFSAIGHPVAGDPLYGTNTPNLGLQRQFLHACSLRFSLPWRKEDIELTSGLPEDLARVLNELRGLPGK